MSILLRLYSYLKTRNRLKQIKKDHGLRARYLIESIYVNRYLNTLNKPNFKQSIYYDNKARKHSVDLKSEISHIKQVKRNQRKKEIIAFFTNTLNFLSVRKLLDMKNTKNNVQDLFDLLSKQISNYKNAIQELVEGQREVTQDKNYRFENGETVQDRLDKFTVKFRENFSFKNIKDSEFLKRK